MIIAPDNITALQPHEIFTYGANEAWRHGSGAAKTALQWGALYHVGPDCGQTYGIPTKDYAIKTLPLYQIRVHVDRFILYASWRPQLTFLVTQVGCGLAGYTPADIAPMFKGAPANVALPQCFVDILTPPVTS